MKRAALKPRSRAKAEEDDDDGEVEIIEVLPAQQGKRRKSSTLFGYGFGSSSSSTTTDNNPPSLPPLPPPPAWGKLIDEQATAKVVLQRFLGYSPPATRRLFTAPYRGTFNDRHNAVPGVGHASSFGRYGSGVRSTLNCAGCLASTGNGGASDGAEAVEGEAGPQWEQEEDEDEDEDDDEDAEAAAIVDAAGPASKARRNFDVVLNWALAHSEILRNCPQDVVRLEILRQEVSPPAADLFWRCFHRARAVCRVPLQQQQQQQWQGKNSSGSNGNNSRSSSSNDQDDPRALLQELLDKQILLDVTQDEDETFLLTHLHDVFSVIRADELVRLNLFLFGSAGASGATATTAATAAAASSSSSSMGGSRRNATRDESLRTLDSIISQCQNEHNPSLLRRKLGKDLVKWLGKDGGQQLQKKKHQQQQQQQQQQQKEAFRLVYVEPGLAKLLQRVFALFFMTNGYDAEDAVVLLWNDLGGLRFVGGEGGGGGGGAGAGGGGGGNGREEEGGKGVPTLAVSASLSSATSQIVELSDDDDGEEGGGEMVQQQQQQQLQQQHQSFAAAPPLPAPFHPLGPPSIPPSYAQLFDSSLSVADAFEQAVGAGDSVTAYACLHAVSDLFLPPPPSSQHERNLNDNTNLLSSLSTLEGEDKNSTGGGNGGGGMGVRRLQPPPNYRGLHDLPRPLFKLLSAVMGRGISLLERERKHGQAVHYLRIVLEGSKKIKWSLRGYFYGRLVLDLGHCNRPGDALEACERALADREVDGEDRLFLQGKCLALAVPPRRWKKPVFPLLRAAPVVRLEMSVVQRRREGGREGRGGSLEDGVLACLLEEEEEWREEEDGRVEAKVGEERGGGEGKEGGRRWQGAHCENNIILTLFGLLCWDVLWLPPTVQQQHSFSTSSSNSSSSSSSSSSSYQYQHAPPDLLLCRDFLSSPARRRSLNKILARIKRGEATTMLAETNTQHAGIVCLGVDWVSFPLATLQIIAHGLGPPALMLLCETLASDYTLLAHGFPDLMLWREGGREKGAEVRLVEVKGPGDSLSLAQKYWIDKLGGVGVRVEVARVVTGEEEKEKGGKGGGGGGRGGGRRGGGGGGKGRE